MFLDHTQRRSTVGRTPLDEWSARSWDLYLTTHDTHNRQISMPPVGFEPTISAGERPQALPASSQLQGDWSESRGCWSGWEAGSMSVLWNAGSNMAIRKPYNFPLWLAKISPTFPYNRHTPYSPTNFKSKLFRSITLKKKLVLFAETSEHTYTTRRTKSEAYHNSCSCVFLYFFYLPSFLIISTPPPVSHPRYSDHSPRRS